MNQTGILSERDSLIDHLSEFLRSIGIGVSFTTLRESTFLPGIYIDGGNLLVDKEKLLYPGDLLHEAGHIAVMEPAIRQQCKGNITHGDEMTSGGEELMAIAWSYAACLQAGLPTEVVFHEGGYKSQGNWLKEQYEKGVYIALPTLQWIGLCYDEKNAPLKGEKPYPHMIKWLRE